MKDHKKLTALRYTEERCLHRRETLCKRIVWLKELEKMNNYRLEKARKQIKQLEQVCKEKEK